MNRSLSASSPALSPRARWTFEDDLASSGLSRNSSAAMARNPSGYYTDTFTSPDFGRNQARFRSDNEMSITQKYTGRLDSVPSSPSSNSSEEGISPLTPVRKERRATALSKEARRRKLVKV